MSSANIPLINKNTPPLNAHLAKPYNKLIEGCWNRGFGLELNQKGQDSEILQNDLNLIRDAIKTAAETLFIDPKKLGQENLSSVVGVEINKGKGFVLMPGKYTSTKQTVYRSETAGETENETIPVLWEHFEDLAGILNTLTHRKCDFNLLMTVNKDELHLAANFEQGVEEGTPEHSVLYDATKGIREENWSVNYKVNEPENLPQEPQKLYYAKLQTDGTWEPWREADCSSGLTISIEKIAAEAMIYSSLEALNWEEHYTIQPAYLINAEVKLEQPQVTQDQLSNGVAKVGCSSCCTLNKNPAALLQDVMSLFQGQRATLLTVSMGTGNELQIAHFMTTYNYAGATYGQYNCNTAFEKSYEGEGDDGQGNRASWKFHYLRRPSGALIPFFWQNNVGVPLNNYQYRIRENGDELQIKFEDGVTQIFNNSTLTRCEYTDGSEHKTMNLPGLGVEYSVDGDFYTFSCVNIQETTELTIYDSLKTYPFAYLYVPAAQLFAARLASVMQTVDSVETDIVSRITSSSDFADTEGYDFSVFFPAETMPDFGEPDGCTTEDIFNQQDILMAKYIELRYGDNRMRGYWRKLDAGLMPSELVIFERTPAALNEFLEIKTDIKFDSRGERHKSIRHTLKKRFNLVEETIAEYRNYGTVDQQEALYQYNEDITSSTYGQLLSSTGFDGSWTRYEYDAAGRIVKEATPFADSPFEAPDDQCRITLYNYDLLRQDENVIEEDNRPRTIISKTLGVETGRTYYLFFEHESWVVTATTPGAAWDAPENRISKEYAYPDGEFAGRHWKTENADGSGSITTYASNEANEWITTVSSGFLPDYGTREIAIQDHRGNTVSRETYDLESGLLTGGTVYTYDNYGRVLTETTVDGDFTATEYNCCGPRFVTAPDGSVTEYGYDAFDRQVFTTAAGLTTIQAYDADDNVVESVLVGREDGELVTRYEYDADGELIREINPAGAETLHENGRNYSKITDALGGTQITERYLDGSTKSLTGTAVYPRSYRYGVENGELYTLECAAGEEQRRTYTDFLGRQYKTVYPDGYTETTVYDDKGRVSHTMNSLGARTLNVYDESTGELKYNVVKRLESTNDIDWENDTVTEYENGYAEYETLVVNYSKTYIHSDSTRTEISSSMSARGGKKSWQTGKGRTNITEILYLGNGAVQQKITDFNGITLTNETSNGMLMTSSHDVLGQTSYAYDEFNRQTGSDHEENGVMVSVRRTLNTQGNPLTVTQSADGSSRTASYSYDLLGRTTAETTPENITTTYVYTPQGQVSGMEGGVYRQQYFYDDRGQLEHLVTYQDQNTPQATTFSYDSRGNMIEKTYADNAHERYSYRGDGKVTSYTKSDGQVHSYSYDLTGQLTGVDSGSELNRDYEYDMLGRLVKITDHTGEYALEYDAYGNQTAETFPVTEGVRVGRTYDANQRLTALTLNESTLVSYAYDADGHLSTIDNGSATLYYEYLAGTDQIESRTWSNRQAEPFLTMTHSYDRYSRLTGVTANGRRQIGYTLNDDDRRMTAELADNTVWSYSYDGLNQLTGAVRRDETETAVNSMTYAYDQIGNRLESEEDGASAAYAANLLNQYTQVNETECIYDANGNMLTNLGWTYTWNTENRLTAAEKDNISVEFDYDYMGRRAMKKVYQNNILTRHEKYVYNGFKLIAIYDGLNADARTHSFVWQPVDLDVPLCMTHGGAEYYHLTDGNKNVTELTDASGETVELYQYGPFGQILTENSQINPFQFSSEFRDPETALIYYNYRYYDPTLGRWTKRDPIEEQDDINLYRIVKNELINFWDTLGNSRLSTDISLGKKIAAILAMRIWRLASMLLFGLFLNHLSKNKVYDLEDVDNELASSIPDYIIRKRLVEIINESYLTESWRKIVFPRANIANYHDDGYLTHPKKIVGDAGTWLNRSSWVFLYGTFEARCKNGKAEWRNVKLYYKWHDQIDALTIEEAKAYGNFDGTTDSAYAAIVEAGFDFIEGPLGIDFHVIIKGRSFITISDDLIRPFDRKK